MNKVDGSNNFPIRLKARYQETLNEQVRKTLARRIHSKVHQARSNPDRAAQRWPFELIQNAHDPLCQYKVRQLPAEN